MSLFGTVEVRAPRFTPCRCAVTCRRTLNPVAEIMPDRCTPEYERTVAKMGSLVPYRRARTLLAEFLPLGKPQAVETTRQRTLRVGTRLEQEAVAGAGPKPSVVTKSVALTIDGGHVRAARQYQGRTFEVLRIRHLALIRERYGFTEFANNGPRLARWLYALCWSGDDHPGPLVERATSWLVVNKVMLPGVSVLERFVGRIRDRAQKRLWERLSGGAVQRDGECAGTPANGDRGSGRQ